MSRWLTPSWALLLLPAALAAADAHPPRVDAYGDPLPAGAVARLGTLRLRHCESILGVAFSPDGRMLVTGGVVNDGIASRLDGVPPKEREAAVVELLTGEEALQLEGRLGACSAVSPDAKLLATGDNDGAVRLLDLATGKGVHRFEGHRGRVCSLVFSQDGDTLITGSTDTTVLLWDVAEFRRRAGVPARPLTPRLLEKLWDDLGGAAGTAYPAMQVLASSPRESVPFLKKSLRPASRVSPERLAELIARLDSKSFSVRTEAARQLRLQERSAMPALRKALEKPASLEARRRIEQLLAARAV